MGERMNIFERLYRKFEVAFIGKKYCSMTLRHGHDMEYADMRGGKGLCKWSLWKCKVCGEEFILDATGFSKA